MCCSVWRRVKGAVAEVVCFSGDVDHGDVEGGGGGERAVTGHVDWSLGVATRVKCSAIQRSPRA